MKRYQYGLLLLALLAVISYVGPSRAGSVNLTAADCAAHDVRC